MGRYRVSIEADEGRAQRSAEVVIECDDINEPDWGGRVLAPRPPAIHWEDGQVVTVRCGYRRAIVSVHLEDDELAFIIGIDEFGLSTPS